jgi:hypothetical protein
VYKHLSCSKFPATVPPKTKQSFRSVITSTITSALIKYIIQSASIHQNRSIDPYRTLSTVQSNEHQNKKHRKLRTRSGTRKTKSKITTITTSLPNPRPNPRPLPKHGNRQRRQSLQASLSRRRLDSNGDASLRWAITPGTQLKPHF